jgi:hypothetical protein
MTKRRITAILFIIGLLVSILTACSGGGETTDPNSGTTADLTDTTETTTEQSIYDTLPTADLGGRTFTIYNNISNFAFTEMSFDELTGEALYDAIYERNTLLEDKLNIDIVEVRGEWNVIIPALDAQVMAGDTTYDMFFNEAGQIVAPVIKKECVNLTDIDTLNLINPWWNKPAIDSVSIGDNTSLLFGEMHSMLYECYVPIAFNKDLITNYNLENLYAVVKNDQWTIDKMYQYMTAVAADLNGDGNVDAGDQFGFSGWQHNVMSFYSGADVKLVEKNDQNIPVFTGITEKLTSVFEKLTSTIFSEKRLIDTGVVHDVFHSGRSAFYVEPLGSLKSMRDVEFELGVLPMPKFNEQQENYTSYIAQFAAAGVIPITNDKLDETGIILENLAAESYRTVKPVYFGVTLDFKYIQDEESQEMLSILFANGTFDLSKVFGWGGFGGSVEQMTVAASTAWNSTITSLEPKIVAGIETTLTALQGQ